MITDNKIEHLVPIPTKILLIIPILVGAGLIALSHVVTELLGGLLVMICLSFIVAVERVKVDFQKKRIKRYLSILGLQMFGKWKPLADFRIITLTADTKFYREMGYVSGVAPSRSRIKLPLMTYKQNKTTLNLKISNRSRILLAKGSYKHIKSVALEIAHMTQKDILDCMGAQQELIQYNTHNFVEAKTINLP